MQAICKVGGAYLSLDRLYEVTENGDMYNLTDDDGDEAHYPIEQFEPITEITKVDIVSEGYIYHQGTIVKLVLFKDINSLGSKTPFFQKIYTAWVAWLCKEREV